MPGKPRGPEDAKASPHKAREKPCPICGKPAAAATKPFCSDRCRKVDLNRWLSGAYVIAANEDDDEDGE
jgi:endogenous inhibitor of DNA gyrase (YacG/DUF329 family)